MIPPVFPILSAYAPVAALVGSNPVRIFESVAPDKTPRDYIVWNLIFGTPENYIGEPPAIDNIRTQIDCVSDTSPGVKALADHVRRGLDPHAVCVSFNQFTKDPATGLWLYSFDWSFWVRRT
ncbi:tail completion protein gp17 [Dokdonella sp. MW10]|uniref:tail completion protein gp17 n=1 Tax=Dokdonella sp. MW10 TaxID=2992926 RepID=UPI003F7D3036